MLEAMPAARPAASATIPMTQGMTMAPRLAAGSRMAMLVTVVIRPAAATAVGFIPAMAKAKQNSSTMAAVWLWASISPK